MKSEKYWKKVALEREIAVQEGATDAVIDIVRIYNSALDDINNEIAKIKANFKRRFGVDDETATYFLDKAQSEDNLNSLIYALENAPDVQARMDILDYIHKDGLSVRAYASRIERYDAVKQTIYSHIKRATIAEIMTVKDTLKNAYKKSYYSLIDDTAKGLNCGINFGIINENAVDEAVNAPWQGKRFSKRIWKRTDDLAKQAQETVIKYLESGRSLDKASSELAEMFDVAKSRATTLVHTETAHVQNKADLKAYNDLGFDEYKYLATLDYHTCSICSPLDGRVFKVSEAREGFNYPTMHPNCRCTTTMNMRYNTRRARNPLTDKNEVINGNITYKEWCDNFTPEQKQAFSVLQKIDRNKYADVKQYEKYKDIIGAENMPKTLAKFTDIKYNDSDKYSELKLAYKNNHNYLQDRLDYDYKGEKNFIPNKTVMSKTKTIAGKGSKTKLRDTDRLVAVYGGKENDWKKRVGKIESEKYNFDVHWYELEGTQYEMKLKNRGDKK